MGTIREHRAHPSESLMGVGVQGTRAKGGVSQSSRFWEGTMLDGLDKNNNWMEKPAPGKKTLMSPHSLLIPTSIFISRAPTRPKTPRWEQSMQEIGALDLGMVFQEKNIEPGTALFGAVLKGSQKDNHHSFGSSSMRNRRIFEDTIRLIGHQ